MSRLVCIGSLNVDLVFRVDRMPESGETVTGSDMERHLGGKGLNQALAAAYDGADVALIGAVGSDEGGEWMLQALARAGVTTDGVAMVPGPSGTALIEVDASGANRIVVIPGANGWLHGEYTTEHVAASGGGIALAPLEVTPTAIVAALRAAKSAGMTTILNPAPVPPDGMPAGLLEVTDIVIPNEHEAAHYTGITVSDTESAVSAGSWFLDRGAQLAVITMGGRGCVWVRRDAHGPDAHGHVPAFTVTPVDTTAAGDAFCGVFAASLAAGLDADAALRRACAAGALATTVHGAAPSLPSAAAITALVEGS